MPWSIEQRDGEYCVVKEGESSPVPGGCHPTRVQAVKHQRALYANEARVAALYAELDRVEEVAQTELEAAHNIRVVLEQPESLTAAMLDTLKVISDRLDAGCPADQRRADTDPGRCRCSAGERGRAGRPRRAPDHSPGREAQGRVRA